MRKILTATVLGLLLAGGCNLVAGVNDFKDAPAGGTCSTACS